MLNSLRQDNGIVQHVLLANEAFGFQPDRFDGMWNLAPDCQCTCNATVIVGSMLSQTKVYGSGNLMSILVWGEVHASDSRVYTFNAEPWSTLTLYSTSHLSCGTRTLSA